jgi:hypothetical protein
MLSETEIAKISKIAKRIAAGMMPSHMIEDAIQDALLRLLTSPKRSIGGLLRDFYRKQTHYHRASGTPRVMAPLEGEALNAAASPGIESEAEAIRYLYLEQKMSQEAVGRALGKSRPTVLTLLRRHGISRRPGGPIPRKLCFCNKPIFRAAKCRLHFQLARARYWKKYWDLKGKWKRNHENTRARSAAA